MSLFEVTFYLHGIIKSQHWFFMAQFHAIHGDWMENLKPRTKGTVLDLLTTWMTPSVTAWGKEEILVYHGLSVFWRLHA